MPPQRSQSASRAGNRRPPSRALIADSQTSQHLQYVHDREEVCPSRAQLGPCNTPYNKFHPKRIVQVDIFLKNKHSKTKNSGKC